MFSSPSEDARAEALVSNALEDIDKFFANLPLGSTREFDDYLRDTLRLNFLFMKHCITKCGDLCRETSPVETLCRHIYVHLYDLGREYVQYLTVFFALHDLIFIFVSCHISWTPLDYVPRTIEVFHWFVDERADVIRLLLEGKCTRRIFNGYGITSECIGVANAEIIDLLFEFGRSFKQSDLLSAVEKKNVYAVRRLLEAGALHNKDNCPMINLQWGFTCGNIEIMRLFMMHGGNPYELDFNNTTTLLSFVRTKLASKENEDCVKELLGYGVDPTIANDDNVLPVDVMLENGYSEECCNLVREAMEKRK